ncbi:hypothetical protein F5887DRAFT_885727 [Amanita rubescens]|nr:hypothetical protein F5887DRAFT_885727 [Amanita rubescens]
MSGGSAPTQAAPKLGKSSSALRPFEDHIHLDDGYRDELIVIFCIPKHLQRDAQDGEVKLYYQKYKACIQAFLTAEEMASAEEWVIRRPTETEIVHLFIGKTMWHKDFTKIFPQVSKYPEMKKWLNDDEDAMSTIDIWGREKASFNFQDFRRWIVEEDNRINKKGKGKAQTTYKKGKKKSGKDDSDDSDSDSDSDSDDGDKKKKKKKKKKKINEEGKSKKHFTRSKGKIFCFMFAIFRLMSMVQSHHIRLLSMLLFIPWVSAAPVNERPFPDISFKEFSTFIEQNFNSSISLTSVLVILFSITENVQLLSLHGRQQKKQFDGEKSTFATSWIRALARPLWKRLEYDGSHLLKEEDLPVNQNDEQITISVASKLDQLAKLLDLFPYNNAGRFTGKLKPVSHKDVQPIYIICPDAVVCETIKCKPRSLPMSTKIRDIPLVILIKGFSVYENVQVLAGYCDGCKTTYYADHERALSDQSREYDKVYLNSAKYIKIGHNLWVDRKFTSAVMSGVYHFHASTAAYTAFWNNVFSDEVSDSGKVGHRHIWQAFVQESIRFMASMADINLILRDNLAIDEVTKGAYQTLGEGGLVRAADGHACEECTQKFRRRSDQPVAEDGSGTVGMDPANNVIAEEFEESMAPVKMVVVDGIVMGHTICAYPECSSELVNARGGVYCAIHEDQHGGICHAANCPNVIVQGTLACQVHQNKWTRFLQNHRQRSLNGYKRALRRQDDNWPWMHVNQQVQQPHDVEADASRDRDAFVPDRIYCIETICAPCGVVVAWAKFAKAESPTNILQFLDHVYPTSESRPNYICIDKACLVLRSSIANGSWNRWQQTRFIVDSYHYTNHQATDILCRDFCNPAPLNGSAPNLVITGTNADGEAYQKRAFNTQACEQLNAWLGGFESILKRMKPGNFNWFLHTMLSYHTVQVLRKQKWQDSSDSDDGDDGDE